MKAIVFTECNEVSFTDLPEPKPSPDDVVVEVKASGICHTDVEVLRGNYGTSAFPLVPGHEYAGTVVELGSAVTGIKLGDHVVVDPNIECGLCRPCKKGWAHLCESLGAYGVTQNGGFVERSLVRSSAVHQIGEMPFDIAALAEPIGCVLNGLDAAQATRAENALIFGAGPIGMLLALSMRNAGVAHIRMADINEERLNLAESFGFEAVAAQGSEMENFYEGIDLVADATGNAAVAGKLIRYIASGGTGLFFGVCPSDAHIEISPFELFRRQITLAGSHSLNHNIPESLNVLRSTQDSMERLVSHRLPMSEIADVFDGTSPVAGLKVQYFEA